MLRNENDRNGQSVRVVPIAENLFRLLTAGRRTTRRCRYYYCYRRRVFARSEQSAAYARGTTTENGRDNWRHCVDVSGAYTALVVRTVCHKIGPRYDDDFVFSNFQQPRQNKQFRARFSNAFDIRREYRPLPPAVFSTSVRAKFQHVFLYERSTYVHESLAERPRAVINSVRRLN